MRHRSACPRRSARKGVADRRLRLRARKAKHRGPTPNPRSLSGPGRRSVGAHPKPPWRTAAEPSAARREVTAKWRVDRGLRPEPDRSAPAPKRGPIVFAGGEAFSSSGALGYSTSIQRSLDRFDRLREQLSPGVAVSTNREFDPDSSKKPKGAAARQAAASLSAPRSSWNRRTTARVGQQSASPGP